MQGEYEQDESRASAVGEEAFVSGFEMAMGLILMPSATHRIPLTIATTPLLNDHLSTSPWPGNSGSITKCQSRDLYLK
jgi:hypothetical protein